MLKKWKSVSVTTVLSAALLLGVTAAPCAANLNNGKATTETTAQAEAPAQTAPATATTSNTAKPAEAPKKQKSILDADALQSPFSFLKDAGGSSDEENSDIAATPSIVVSALKALAATLLSTIM